MRLKDGSRPVGEEIWENDAHISPERALLLSVIAQAQQDYVDGAPRNKETAKLFLFNPRSMQGKQFEHYCFILDVSASAIRKATAKMERESKKGRVKKYAPRWPSKLTGAAVAG